MRAPSLPERRVVRQKRWGSPFFLQQVPVNPGRDKPAQKTPLGPQCAVRFLRQQDGRKHPAGMPFFNKKKAEGKTRTSWPTESREGRPSIRKSSSGARSITTSPRTRPSGRPPRTSTRPRERSASELRRRARATRRSMRQPRGCTRPEEKRAPTPGERVAKKRRSFLRRAGDKGALSADRHGEGSFAFSLMSRVSGMNRAVHIEACHNRKSRAPPWTTRPPSGGWRSPSRGLKERWGRRRRLSPLQRDFDRSLSEKLKQFIPNRGQRRFPRGLYE